MCLNKLANHDELVEARLTVKEPEGNEKAVISDYLAQGTQYTRRSFNVLMAGAVRLQKSDGYK